MKKIFCKFLSVILTLILFFNFFSPRYARAITLTEILSDCANVTSNCLDTLKFLNNIPGLNISVESTQNVDQLWNKERVLKTLYLIFLKIISTPRNSEGLSFNDILSCSSISLEDYIERFLVHTSKSEELPISTTGKKLSLMTTSKKMSLVTTSEKLPAATTSEKLSIKTKNKKLPIATIIVTLIFLDRIQRENKDRLVINYRNIYKLFALSYLIAFKACDDFCYSNADMALISKIPVISLDRLEILFLLKANSNLTYQDKFDEYYDLFTSLLRKIHNLDLKAHCT